MTLTVHESGTPGAPSIVFLHGIGTSAWMWQEQTAALPDFHCLVPDLPGHGASAAELWRSLPDTAHLIAGIIRARATQGRAHVVGLSLGAYIAMQLLLADPAIVDHAVLSGLNVLPLPNARLLGAAGRVLAPLMRTELMIRANARALRVPADKYAVYRDNIRRMSSAAFLQASADAARFRLPAEATHSTVPTLVVAGQREHPLMFQSMAAIIAVMAHAKARVAPNVGHGWNGEHPDLFNRMIRAWITDQPLPFELGALPAQLATSTA